MWQKQGIAQLRSYCAADLHLYFGICKKQVFSWLDSFVRCCEHRDENLERSKTMLWFWNTVFVPLSAPPPISAPTAFLWTKYYNIRPHLQANENAHLFLFFFFPLATKYPSKYEISSSVKKYLIFSPKINPPAGSFSKVVTKFNNIVVRPLAPPPWGLKGVNMVGLWSALLDGIFLTVILFGFDKFLFIFNHF